MLWLDAPTSLFLLSYNRLHSICTAFPENSTDQLH